MPLAEGNMKKLLFLQRINLLQQLWEKFTVWGDRQARRNGERN